jgi:hypothetical protein
MTYDDVIISMFYFDDKIEYMSVEFHVITRATRTAALLMTSCIRALVDSYSIFCAKQAMLFRFVVKLYWQRRYDEHQAFYKKHMGVAWPLMTHVHPVMTMTAEDAYLMTLLEFVS